MARKHHIGVFKTKAQNRSDGQFVDYSASLMLKEKSVLNIFYCLLKRIRIKIKYSNNCHAYTFRTKENIV